MKTSENNTRLSVLLHLFFLFFILLSSCSSVNKNQDNHDDVFYKYHEILYDLREVTNMDCNTLVANIKDWQECADMTFQRLVDDTASLMCNTYFDNFYFITDSIKYEFVRIAKNMNYTLHDYTYIKLNTLNVSIDSVLMDELYEARSFFFSIRESDVLDDISSDNLIQVYKDFLVKSNTRKIVTERQFKEFLYSEDILFNTFLSNLSWTWDDDYSDITELTEDLCSEIYSFCDNTQLKKETVFSYMTIRAIRRLFKNATVAKSMLLSGDVNIEEAQVYFYMTMQPILLLDNLKLMVLTQEERQTLLGMSNDMDLLINNYGKQWMFDKQQVRDYIADLLAQYLLNL